MFWFLLIIIFIHTSSSCWQWAPPQGSWGGRWCRWPGTRCSSAPSGSPRSGISGSRSCFPESRSYQGLYTAAQMQHICLQSLKQVRRVTTHCGYDLSMDDITYRVENKCTNTEIILKYSLNLCSFLIHGHFLSTWDLPPSSYSCLLTHLLR